MREARKKLRLCSQARVVGVAFFDFKHGQTERRPERDRTASDIQLRLPLRLGRPGGEPERPGRYRATAMLYDVLVVSNGGGGKRFTIAIGAAARTQVQVAFRAREVTALLLLSLDWRAQGERRSI